MKNAAKRKLSVRVKNVKAPWAREHMVPFCVEMCSPLSSAPCGSHASWLLPASLLLGVWIVWHDYSGVVRCSEATTLINKETLISTL